MSTATTLVHIVSLKRIALILSILFVWLFCVWSSVYALQESDEIAQLKVYIQQRVSSEWVWFLPTYSEKLKYVAKNNKNLYVSWQIHTLRLRIDATYGKEWVSIINQWTTLKWPNRKFVLADWSRYSNWKSTIPKASDIKNQEEQIQLTKNQDDVKAENLPTVVPKASSYGAQKPLLISDNERTVDAPTIASIWSASVWATIELSWWWTIDVARVQRAWQWRVNDLRRTRSLPVMSFDTTLHKTATDWATTIRNKKSADHKRFASSPYYSYPQITERFRQRGVVFKNVARATYTENIWWASFRCTSWDCTDEAIAALKNTYMYFRNEEWKAYDVHRRTMIHPLFGVMGVGIAVDESGKRIYIAIHYGTEVE